MDDSDIALEKAVMNLDLGDDQESSDSEVEREEEMEPHMNGGGRVPAAPERSTLSEERVVKSLTRERVERLYPSAPSEEHIYDVPNGDQLSQISEGCISTSSAVSSMVPITLAAVVADDRLFLMFRRFLKDQCITRNLNFWLACEHYRQLSTDNREHLLDVAKAIYIKFIKNSAPQKVAILPDTKNRIKKSLDYKSEPLTVQLFDTAQQEIWEVMERNEVLQFAVSESFADCSQFTGLSLPNSSYMANPAYGVRGAGSLQHSGSEDSASLSSFSTDSDAGPRSAVMGQHLRPCQSARKALSDTEGSRPKRRNQSQQQQTHKLYAAKDNPVSSEMFVALVTERLLAVEKDRKAMEQRVRDDARRMGRNFHDIMSLEWYDHLEARKYLLFEMNSSSMANPTSSSSSMAAQENEHLHQSHSVKHILSPHSPGATPRSSQDHGKKTLAHINSLAQQEVEYALKDFEITNQVNKKRRGYGPMSTSSSVYSTYSDSGVGGDWATATSGLVTPIHDHTQAYVKVQSMLNQQMPTRQREAQAAAIALISNSPQPDMLNPHVPRGMQHHHHGERQKRSQFVRNYPGAYSSDDSSSCYTMTSQSSASEALFVPARKHTQSVYTESDEPHHFPHHQRFKGTRQLSQPRRSYKQQQQQQHHQQHPQSTPSPMSQSHRQQQQQQLSQSGSGGGGSRSSGGGDTLIVYHFDDFPTPFAKRIGGGEITLSDFKEKVFIRKGEYRFFFKSYCEDLQMEIMEEYSEEGAVLPLVQGKIIGRVEKAST